MQTRKVKRKGKSRSLPSVTGYFSVSVANKSTINMICILCLGIPLEKYLGECEAKMTRRFGGHLCDKHILITKQFLA